MKKDFLHFRAKYQQLSYLTLCFLFPTLPATRQLWLDILIPVLHPFLLKDMTVSQRSESWGLKWVSGKLQLAPPRPYSLSTGSIFGGFRSVPCALALGSSSLLLVYEGAFAASALGACLYTFPCVSCSCHCFTMPHVFVLSFLTLHAPCHARVAALIVVLERCLVPHQEPLSWGFFRTPKILDQQKWKCRGRGGQDWGTMLKWEH